MTQDADLKSAQIRRFTRILAWAAAILAGLPALIGWLTTPPGSSYLGYQFSTDDQMVYGAWMHQAMSGSFFFDNRFTTEPQPGLTVHLYFWLLGQPARLIGIAWAETLARIGFSFLAVHLLSRLISRLQVSVYTHKLALALTVFGGGIGFLCWQMFGVAMGSSNPLSGVMRGQLPTDVWQPEGFVFPSMLTTSLFVMSLCLILAFLDCVLDAQESAKKVGLGALCIGLLMNVHSYDVLLLGVVLVGLLVASAVSKTLSKAWVLRVLAMMTGVIPAALWFVYVYRNDPVFQMRAATPTWSPTFQQITFGYLPLLVLAVFSLWPRGEFSWAKRRLGFGLASLLLIGIFSVSWGHTDGTFLNWTFAGVLLAFGVISIGLMAKKCAAWNLVSSWALLGLILPFVPVMFQRKLLMGLAIPLAILAAICLADWIEKRDRNSRNLATALAIIVCSASSVFWLQREVLLIRGDVARTITLPVYLGADVRVIFEILEKTPGKKIVAAMPGIDLKGDVPDSYASPYIPDLNTLASGLTGSYTFAGHWSETPEYGKARNMLYGYRGNQQPSSGLFGTGTTAVQRSEILKLTKANYLIAPVPNAFEQLPIADLTSLGKVLYKGGRFVLIQVP